MAFQNGLELNFKAFLLQSQHFLNRHLQCRFRRSEYSSINSPSLSSKLCSHSSSKWSKPVFSTLAFDLICVLPLPVRNFFQSGKNLIRFLGDSDGLSWTTFLTKKIFSKTFNSNFLANFPKIQKFSNNDRYAAISNHIFFAAGMEA